MKAGSRLEQVLTSGRFAVTAELGPPKGADPGAMRKRILEFKPYVDAINFVDNALGNVRMNSLAAAAICLQAGVEPVLQMTCRDRNLIALQSDALGAAGLGIKNVLCLTGDHQTMGNHAMAQGVFELGSIQLIALLKRMRDEQKLHSGEALKHPPQFFIGGAKNPFSGPVTMRAQRLGKKIEAGADFIQTQPVFDLEHFKYWMRLVRGHGYHEQVHIIAGILAFKSAKTLRYMKENTPGVRIPDALIARMDRAENPEEEAIRIAVETIQAVREIPGIRGVHIMPVMAEAAVPEIIRRAGITPPVPLPLRAEGGG